MFRFAKRIVHTEEEAVDIVQESFLRIWKNKQKLKEVDNQEAWCMRITKNIALDKLKSGHVKHIHRFPEHFDVATSSTLSPERVTETNDMIASMRKIINTLPENYQQVIHLRDIEGYTYKEICDIMELDMSNIKTNLFRARKEIRNQLNKLVNYGL